MRIISKRTLREYWAQSGRGDSEQPLRLWYSIVSKASWASHNDLKGQFGSRVDLAHGLYVFDMGGNKYRVIYRILFGYGRVLIRWVGTHAEYDELNKRGGAKMRDL